MSLYYKEPWGFSKLDVFQTCKAKFKYQFIDKLPQASSPAMARGQAMHENIESYLNGWTSTLLAENLNFKPEIDALRTKNYVAEQALGFDSGWNKLASWFEKTTWLRVKMDARVREDDTVTTIDFKSGKYRIPSTEQIELYAVVCPSLEPGATKFVSEFWFLDIGDVYRQSYTLEQVLALRKKYEDYAAQLYATAVWEPQPSNECRWCPYSKTKGGPCKY